jgi:S-adenosylmethionine hydrolase
MFFKEKLIIMVLKISIKYKTLYKLNFRTLYFLKNREFYQELSSIINIELFGNLDAFLKRHSKYKKYENKIEYRISRKSTAIENKRIYFNKKHGLMLIRIRSL